MITLKTREVTFAAGPRDGTGTSQGSVQTVCRVDTIDVGLAELVDAGPQAVTVHYEATATSLRLWNEPADGSY